MEKDFTMQEFNPTIAELTQLSLDYRGMKIDWVEDKDWYEKVKRAQLDLRSKRTSISKMGKAMRDKATAFSRKVIEEERKLIGIIEETEKELKAERDRIDYIFELEKRAMMLPYRKEELARFELEIPADDVLLEMDEAQFGKYLQEIKEKKFSEMQEEKRRKEEAEQRAIREEQIRKETEERAIRETEERLKKEAEEKELKIKAEEEAKRKETEERELAAKKEMEEKEKNTKYQNWLKENNYNESEYFIKIEGNKRKLYKFISEFEL